MSSAALSYSKIPQTRAESSSLLEYYAECSFILFKDTTNESRIIKLAWMLYQVQLYLIKRYCRGRIIKLCKDTPSSWKSKIKKYFLYLLLRCYFIILYDTSVMLHNNTLHDYANFSKNIWWFAQKALSLHPNSKIQDL